MKTIEIANTGQLTLFYKIIRAIEEPKTLRDYCEAKGGGGEGEYIQRVQIGNIDKTSGSNEYSDYTNLATSIETGETHQLMVTNGNGFGEDQCGAWIDWDQNGIFDEEMITFEGSPGVGPYTAIITPPIGAKTGTTRLRIRLSYTGNLSPCGTTIWGEVEDYSLEVNSDFVPWLTLAPPAGSVVPGSSSYIDVTFNSTGFSASAIPTIRVS